MGFTELAVLLFLVSDPFGNLPIVLATLQKLPKIIFVFGRRVADRLKPTGLRAIERFMGLLLSLLSVNMTLYGIKLYFG